MSKLRNAGRGVSRRRVLTATAGWIAAPAVLPSTAHAAWPTDKPVRVVVANSAGGPSDISARLIAPALQEALGGAFVVENRPGGGSVTGMLGVSRAEPDGYTLLVATSGWSTSSALYAPPPYDPIKDIIPLCEIGGSPSVFVVQPSLGVSTLKEAVALARKDPTKFNIASPPMGSTLHLGGELLKIQEGLKDVALVLHSGGGQAIQALLSGVVQMCSSSLAPAHEHIKAGTLKCLAILGEERWPDMPDVPTAAEAGYPGFLFETRTGLMAPPKTPPEIVARLEKAAVDALAKPDLRAKYERAGFIVRGKPGKDYAASIASEVTRFGEIISKAGIKPKPL